MKIGLFGYGKMGKTIEKLARYGGHQVVWRINSENRDSFTPEKLREADVAIEFSRPEAAYPNVRACLDAGLPVVCGTTGWLPLMPLARQVCLEKNGAFFWASNFSIGVNLFFLLNKKLAKMMENQPDFTVHVADIHHVHKLDAPSGTAVTLAEGIIEHSKELTEWRLFPSKITEPVDVDAKTLPIFSIREGETIGKHSVIWDCGTDYIHIEHVARSRDAFAAGAILAATWLVGKQGVFGMDDLLDIK